MRARKRNSVHPKSATTNAGNNCQTRQPARTHAASSVRASSVGTGIEPSPAGPLRRNMTPAPLSERQQVALLLHATRPSCETRARGQHAAHPFDAVVSPAQYAAWSTARRRAWDRRRLNPDAYFLHYLHPSLRPAPRKWSLREHAVFLAALHRASLQQWGLFSLLVPGRLGTECRRYYHRIGRAGFITIGGSVRKTLLSRARVKERRTFLQSANSLFLKRSLRKFLPDKLPDIDDTLYASVQGKSSSDVVDRDAHSKGNGISKGATISNISPPTADDTLDLDPSDLELLTHIPDKPSRHREHYELERVPYQHSHPLDCSQRTRLVPCRVRLHPSRNAKLLSTETGQTRKAGPGTSDQVFTTVKIRLRIRRPEQPTSSAETEPSSHGVLGNRLGRLTRQRRREAVINPAQVQNKRGKENVSPDQAQSSTLPTLPSRASCQDPRRGAFRAVETTPHETASAPRGESVASHASSHRVANDAESMRKTEPHYSQSARPQEDQAPEFLQQDNDTEYEKFSTRKNSSVVVPDHVETEKNDASRKPSFQHEIPRNDTSDAHIPVTAKLSSLSLSCFSTHSCHHLTGQSPHVTKDAPRAQSNARIAQKRGNLLNDEGTTKGWTNCSPKSLYKSCSPDMLSVKRQGPFEESPREESGKSISASRAENEANIPVTDKNSHQMKRETKASPGDKSGFKSRASSSINSLGAPGEDTASRGSSASGEVESSGQGTEGELFDMDFGVNSVLEHDPERVTADGDITTPPTPPCTGQKRVVAPSRSDRASISFIMNPEHLEPPRKSSKRSVSQNDDCILDISGQVEKQLKSPDEKASAADDPIDTPSDALGATSLSSPRPSVTSRYNLTQTRVDQTRLLLSMFVSMADLTGEKLGHRQEREMLLRSFDDSVSRARQAEENATETKCSTPLLSRTALHASATATAPGHVKIMYLIPNEADLCRGWESLVSTFLARLAEMQERQEIEEESQRAIDRVILGSAGFHVA